MARCNRTRSPGPEHLSRATCSGHRSRLPGWRRSARWTIPGRRRSPCAASRVDGGWLVAVKIENGGVAISGTRSRREGRRPPAGYPFLSARKASCRRRIAFLAGLAGLAGGQGADSWRRDPAPAAKRHFRTKIRSRRRPDSFLAARATCCRSRDSLFLRKSSPASGTTSLIFVERDLPASDVVPRGNNGSSRWQEAFDGEKIRPAAAR